MSGVSPSDRKKQTDELRSFREETSTREAEEAKRHKKEIKRLQAAQNKEMEKLKQSYDERITGLRSKSTEIMSERDLANQAKIDKLRALYSDSLKKKTEESENRRGAEKESFDNRIYQQKQISGLQRENLERNFKESLSEKDKQFEQLSKRSTQEMQEAIQTRAEKLNEKHSRELELMRQGQDESKIRGQRDLAVSRIALGGQLKDTKRKASEDLKDNDSNWRNIYDSKMVEVNEVLTDKNQNLQMAGKKMQNRFKNALDSKLSELDGAHQVLKDQTAERINGDIRSLETENRLMKNHQMSELNKNRAQHNVEKSHLVEAYEDRMKKLTDSKDALVDRTQEVNRARMRDNTDKNESILQKVVTRSKTDQIIANERHKEDRANIEMMHKSDVQRIGNKTDQRYNKILRNSIEAQKEQERMRKENLAELKDGYSTELSNQRQTQLEMLRDTRLGMDEKMKSLQNKFANKLDENTNAYEARLQESEQNRLKELNSQAKALNQRMVSQEKQFQAELKSQEMKTDLRLGQQQQNHEKEVDRLQKRHQEQMASLVQKLNYYRKG